MKYEPFDCCHAYNECSDLGRCIMEAGKRNVCTYWLRHLSNGVAFYGKNPGLLEGYVFIKIGNRAFRISKRKKDNSYIMDRAYRNILTEQFKLLGIPYSTRAEGECVITGCPENPAKYKVDFEINENEYTIKNYNGWALEADVAQTIIEELGDRLKLMLSPPFSNRANRTVIEYYGGYYGKETMVVFEAENKPRPLNQLISKPLSAQENVLYNGSIRQEALPHKPTEDNMKLPSGDALKQGKLIQISVWDVMWGRI